ncbi:ribonuclease P protein component [Candidatus Kaiserbacteria bacterium CG10_big_fil_rev_8_21_14_0_10_49_17]|uniref:Ribonuclease P protein component n=1 Tax=Candidatus Kaiserbacteria bacterium CG10_big_fil_rev_8_21_14_0_10_49_17 TaxID=1974609 RepID=A0A2M6WDN5_9BACT|nr:MAG: ribonuclease P protein component [Candidatus Kaiserbacteria bacterium CG10_big_fil_rev_8_21_14_0_10_49_17]
MFQKKTRLSRADIHSLITSGRAVNSQHFSARFNTSSKPSKCAVVVSKKVASKAVERNTLKRRMRASLLTALNGLSGCNIVLFARKGANSLSFSELQEEVAALIGNIHTS